MTDSNTPIILVVCNDYGELAHAIYLIAHQSFARNTILMLPPGLYNKNPDILPGQTFVYNSLDDVKTKLESETPGILGLFSGYLLPVHRLCDPAELESLVQTTQAKGWKLFTSDPFLGLLDDIEPGELVTLEAPRWTIIWSIVAAHERKRLSYIFGEMHRILNGALHVYPCGGSPTESNRDFATRLHFHNAAFHSQLVEEKAAHTAKTPQPQKWLFVLGDQDYTVQLGKHGILPIKFRKLLTRKLHETLDAGRTPTLIAPAKVIESIRKHSPVADAIELLGHCGYSEFQSLLQEAEYVFYWNAVSFSCLVRTLSGKPWFTFDDGHLLRGMNADYAHRIFDWFYQGGQPPRLEMDDTLTADALQQATMQYLKPAWRMQQALLATSDSSSLLSAMKLELTDQEREMSTSEAFQILQQLGEVISTNKLDGNHVFDAGVLATPKSEIRSAGALLIERGSPEEAALARSAVPTLAFFQAGVDGGPLPIDSPGPNGKPWRNTVEADLLRIVEGLPNEPATSG